MFGVSNNVLRMQQKGKTMFIIFKIISSSLVLVLITEIAKRNPSLGGLMVVLPVNILLSLVWLYVENKNIPMLVDFTNAAIMGFFPTLFFLLILAFLFSKHTAFMPAILIGLTSLSLFVFLQHNFFSHT